MALSVADRVRHRADGAGSGAGAGGDWLERAARAGLVARGVLHLVVAFLTWRIAFGRRDERADPSGALEAVVRQPLGRALVLVLAVGFAGYAVWRAAQAVFDPEHKSSGASGVAKRLAFAGRSLMYATLAWLAASFAWSGSGSATNKQELTARVLGLPFGRWIVGAVGVGVLAIGGYNAWKGLSGKFKDDLKSYEISSSGERRAIMTAAVIGFVGRASAYVLVGVFVLRAAWRYDPNEGVGLDAALKRLADRGGSGPWLLLAVALGLAAYGLYELALARYKRLLEGR